MIQEKNSFGFRFIDIPTKHSNKKSMIDYLSILNHLPDAICVIGQSNHEVLFVNDTFNDNLLPRHIITNKDISSEIFKPEDEYKFNEAIKSAHTSIDDVIIGTMSTLSHIGEFKCKNLNVDIYF